MFSVDVFKISLTPINSGLLFEIIQERGDIETSHWEKAYKASIVLEIDDPVFR